MRAKRIRWAEVHTLAILGVLATITPGCLFSPDPTDPVEPEPEYGPRTTISGVLDNLVEAYENRDLDRYTELFSDQFNFVFDPVDVEEDPEQDIPPNWDWNQELISTRKMFESELVERIQLEFVDGAPELATENDLGDFPFREGTFKVILTAVTLSVDTRDPAGGENITFLVSGDQAIFFLYQDSEELQDGLPVWKILEWRDKKIG